jgi:pyridoxamine 5'-phosphate oxidase
VSHPGARPLRSGDLDQDPARQLERWRDSAEAEGEVVVEAAALATATRDGRPSVRMVLVKGFDEGGLRFFTGYESRKGQELAANPRAALCFYWQRQGRQVRVEGVVEMLPEADSDGYFATRPAGARFSAAASSQGQVVAGRDELEARVAELRRRHPDEDVPRPSHWGGYRLVPDAYEFWQHRDDRLHDRFGYRREDGCWVVERLAP